MVPGNLAFWDHLKCRWPLYRTGAHIQRQRKIRRGHSRPYGSHTLGSFAKKGEWDRALQDYSAAIDMNPRNAIYHANRGYLLATARGKNSAVAIADLRRALVLDPSLIEAMKALKRLQATGSMAREGEQRVRLGRQLAEKNCSACHAVGTKGMSPNKNATEFRDIYRRHRNMAIRSPVERAITYAHYRTPIEMSDRQIDAVVAYIDSFVPTR